MFVLRAMKQICQILDTLAVVNDAAINIDDDKLSLKYVDDLTIIENTYVNKCSTIQSDIDKFSQWAADSNMLLNPSKCMSMDINFTKNPKEPVPIQLCGLDLQCTDVVKILGIKMSSDLKWDIQA